MEPLVMSYKSCFGKTTKRTISDDNICNTIDLGHHPCSVYRACATSTAQKNLSLKFSLALAPSFCRLHHFKMSIILNALFLWAWFWWLCAMVCLVIARIPLYMCSWVLDVTVMRQLGFQDNHNTVSEHSFAPYPCLRLAGVPSSIFEQHTHIYPVA